MMDLCDSDRRPIIICHIGQLWENVWYNTSVFNFLKILIIIFLFLIINSRYYFFYCLTLVIFSSFFLGCTDTSFLAPCRCRTCVGHQYGYDSPNFGVRRVSFFFFFVSPTRLRRVRHASSEEKENTGVFQLISAVPANSGVFRR